MSRAVRGGDFVNPNTPNDHTSFFTFVNLATLAAAAAATTTTTTTHAAGCSAKVVKTVGFVDAKAMLKKIKEMEEDDGE